ncbi:Magnesium-chelatase 38 kDa subunit [Corynebacterium ciconiae DSM 44920]|uniref:ATP-binding protein n=1 Tax=Corynebacterium ciconiae TaxID=227319 RepID=UPI000367B786|nr:AAA family ATPase [Corynebacterium ciconiae]WKD61456.1 Magnesium-chelatase 38 kDa subunit [Corynebacterium ciconiae DSM 44920]
MTEHTPVPGFPFTAIVGQDQLRLALLLNAISPGIGGVCVRGEKGTAKTTMVRGFAPLLDGSLVNLPLGATEDRVVGSINVETILTTGKAEYKPGLLAEADGGILYVDEVNLLADHLVDALLDAAATGRVTIERDGVSYSAPAQFVLVGTMNPEEGELRPQLLDRFGLAVEVAGSKDPKVRGEIITRRLAYENDPHGFAAQWQEHDAALKQQLDAARAAVAHVQLPSVQVARIAQLCAAFDVDGMRADIVIARTAIAHAALRGNEVVDDEDVRVAAQLALPHRKRRNPFDEPGMDESELDEKLDQAIEDNPDPAEPPTEPEPDDPADSSEDLPQPEGDGSEEEPDTEPQRGDGKGDSASMGAPFRR